MATKIRPIVFRINEPEGFVMNASNATYTPSSNLFYVTWHGPVYPDGYNGNGKQYILVNNNSEAPDADQFMYATTNGGGGPDAISKSDMLKLGTTTGVLLNNSVPLDYGYGAQFTWAVRGTLEEVQAYVANLTITIVDP